MQPGQVFQHVLEALRDRSENTQIRTVPFAQAKFVNDITGRFYNSLAPSSEAPICFPSSQGRVAFILVSRWMALF